MLFTVCRDLRIAPRPLKLERWSRDNMRGLVAVVLSIAFEFVALGMPARATDTLPMNFILRFEASAQAAVPNVVCLLLQLAPLRLKRRANLHYSRRPMM